MQIHSNPDVFMVQVPFFRGSAASTNCFALVDSGETLLVDLGVATGVGKRTIISMLDALGLDVDTVSVFLTHLHLDHASMIRRFSPKQGKLIVGQKEYDAAVSSSAKLERAAIGRRYRSEGIPHPDIDIARVALRGSCAWVEDKPNLRLIREGDVVTVGTRSLVAVGTSGHTFGHMSLYEPVSGVLFGGDHILFDVSPSITIYPNGTDAYGDYLANLEKIRKLEVKTLLHAHGQIRDDFNERIDQLIANSLRRAKETSAIISDMPNSTGFQIIQSIRWNTASDDWKHIPLHQKSAVIMKGLAILDHLISEHQVFFDTDSRGLRHYSLA